MTHTTHRNLYFFHNLSLTVGPIGYDHPMMNLMNQTVLVPTIGITHGDRVLVLAGTCECGNYVTGESLVVAIRGTVYCQACA